VRMTNLNLEPGEGSLEELLADVDDGLYLETNKSWSIDDKRLNFQFGTQIAWEVKRGRLGRMLRDATYTGITPQLWGSLDTVAGPEVHQPTLVEDVSVSLRLVVDGRVGVAATNDLADEGLRRLARRAADSAASAPAEESFPGLAEPAPLPTVSGYDADTAALEP